MTLIKYKLTNMETNNLPSTAWTLKARDFFKGLIMFVGTPVLYLLQELIPGYHLNPLIQAAISATITYLLKNLVTDDVKQAQKIVHEAKQEAVKEKIENSQQ